MTPATADILAGNARVIAGLAEHDSGPDYAAARLGVVAMLCVLAAQEAATGVAVRVAENAAIAAVIGEAAEITSLTIPALDAANATLRRKLIAYHEHVEHDAARDAEILALYRSMAEARLLVLPPM